MRRIFQIVAFLRTFTVGIMTPVLALALLAHGASITTISLLLGAYSLTVIIMEFPSGVFADLCGRKNAFLLSMFIYMVCFSTVLFSKSMPMLLLAMVANGLGRAFSSGSLDALAIDDAVANGGVLAKVTGQLSILESAGLAAGALTGGWLSGIGEAYIGNILGSLVLYGVLFFLTLFFVKEQRIQEKREEATAGSRIGMQVKESIAFMAQKGLVRVLLVFSFLTGFAMLAIETYWQPALSALSPAAWLLGAVSFAGFFSVIFGSKVVERLLVKSLERGAMWMLACKALFGVSLIVLLFQFQTPLFIGVYMLAYLFMGGGSVAENTLLNEMVDSNQRASVLSLFSFILQVGGLFASLIGYVVSAKINYRYMWLIAGVLLLIGVVVLAIVYARQRRKAVMNNVQQPSADKAEETSEVQPCAPESAQP